MDIDPVTTTSSKRRFRFVECLGRGGFGEVYRAAMTDRGGVRTDVAVKVLHEEVDPTSQAVRRLRDEAHVLAALRHPSILRVYDLVVLEGRVALVTEFVDGQDLTGLIRSEPRIPRRPLCDVVGQVASALAAAHDSVGEHGVPLGLVHRDVKPHNIRIGRHGEVKLLDFGIARGSGIERTASTTNGSIVGSLQYMAPESFDGDQRPASDVFSLGCVMFEGLCGQRPWQGLEPRDLYALGAREGGLQSLILERLGRLPEDLPADLRSLVTGMLDPDPELRPAAAEVARRCEDLVDQLEGPTLRRWCAQRAWPGPHARKGEFDGREVTEGEQTGRPLISPRTGDSHPGDTIEHSGTRTRGRTRAVAMAASGMAGLTIGGVVLVGLLLVVVSVVAWSRSGPEEGRAPAPRPPTPAPVIAPTPRQPPPPPVEPEPTTAQPQAPTTPVTTPAPPPPVVAPAPEPPADPSGTARVRVDDKTRTPVRLRMAGEIVTVPAEVRAGVWNVEARFGDTWAHVDTIDLSSGEQRTVSCNSLLRNCVVR
ncbi:MAG: serine/threonine protein kinase [Alphaproteobacteria bacterium]|nr:serine/threonine protein kinase [Alphaproteobacteria bacterium]MCB9695479.1 serine/threonine protein kinase [Alphaproteobacteria bacterium]